MAAGHCGVLSEPGQSAQFAEAKENRLRI